jgi:type I restriction-modification system DNA methylase subunit
MYGVEEQDSIIALAIVNMIFRGDGKNNMIEGNCFRKWLNAKSTGKSYRAEYVSKDVSSRIAPITKVMMNPPFALKKGDEKEYKFIEHALNQMEDGGLLFAILPISVLVEKTIRAWRKDILLKQNKLKAVITFPEDLFYPVSVGTIGIFIQKGIPHNFNSDKVYYARCINDGFSKKKGIRKKNIKVRNMLEEVKNELSNHLFDKEIKVQDVPEFKKLCLLNEEDKNCELVAEAYIDSRSVPQSEIEKGVEGLIREAVAFEIRFHDQLN